MQRLIYSTDYGDYSEAIMSTFYMQRRPDEPLVEEIRKKLGDLIKSYQELQQLIEAERRRREEREKLQRQG